MPTSNTADSATLERWLRLRIATELKAPPESIDLDQSAESFALDSLLVVQICAELGNWLQGRELSIDLWWEAPSLRAFCNRCATAKPSAIAVVPSVALEGDEGEVSSLGAPLARSDAGKQLVLLSRVTLTALPGERYQLATLPREPDLVSVSYRQVDEATGETKPTMYYGGTYSQYIRAWVTPVTQEDGMRYDLYVLNSGTRVVAVVAAAWSSNAAIGGAQ